MKKFEIICTADAQITERWHVEAENEADARGKFEGIDDPADADFIEQAITLSTGLEFIEQIEADHEENREIVSVTEVTPDTVLDVDPDAEPEQAMVILVAVVSDENQAGFAVIREDVLEAHEGDLFSLFYNDGPADTFDTWAAAVAHVAECGGEIVDVQGAIAY